MPSLMHVIVGINKTKVGDNSVALYIHVDKDINIDTIITINTIIRTSCPCTSAWKETCRITQVMSPHELITICALPCNVSRESES